MSAAWASGLRAAEPELADASALMEGFALRTGLGGDRPSRRYLWTDAFAVCNFLALWRATGAERWRERALALVDEVHHVLGRHRADDARGGWLSGLGEREGELHPTRGGLRIGKKLPERPPDAPYDERLEWDRDGQYFHYLTRWMHALDQTARRTGAAHLNVWARELADVAHRAFTRASPGGRGMVWKTSTDLSRALVPSMGQHDPLDGLVTCLQLRATATAMGTTGEGPTLEGALSDFARLLEGRPLATADPLGLGGLLVDAARVEQLLEQGATVPPGLLEALLGAALAGLGQFARHELHAPAARRLAFRELGLALGLAALGPMEASLSGGACGFAVGARLRTLLGALTPHAALGSRITSFWRDPASRGDPLRAEHADIDEVMLATCLAPEGVLVLAPPTRGRG